MRRLPAAVALLLAAGLLCRPAAAQQPVDGLGDIKGLKLGMSLPEGEIEGAYQSTLAGEVEDSVGLSFPFDHIETRLIDGSRLTLHFSSAEDGARLFWIRLATSWRWPVERPAPDLAALLAQIESRFGTPARSLGTPGGTGDLLLVFAAPGSSTDLPETLDLKPEEIGGVQFMSYQQRVALFGRDFVGAVITIVRRDGEVAAVIEELADHRRGATVLDPGD